MGRWDRFITQRCPGNIPLPRLRRTAGPPQSNLILRIQGREVCQLLEMQARTRSQWRTIVNRADARWPST